MYVSLCIVDVGLTVYVIGVNVMNEIENTSDLQLKVRCVEDQESVIEPIR